MNQYFNHTLSIADYPYDLQTPYSIHDQTTTALKSALQQTLETRIVQRVKLVNE